ncbi:PH domain-containing protein [Haloarcula marina]|uniref:PH domain-containing protein n=1 Tax=Haloarcula marina TaxID=2961574 RepID=UPI0020B7E87D|nr:PH domain-containing protein [Halomicroarcula marina]
MSRQDPQTPDATAKSTTEDTVVLRTNPTTKPTLIRLGVVLLLTLGVFGYLQLNPEALGSPDITNTGAIVVLLLGLILTVRFLIRTLVLVRTTYVVTDDHVEQRYELLFRTHSKGVRFDKLRSHELTQNRIQSVLGYGTISMNRGLGTLRLESVNDPETVYAAVQAGAKRAD